MLQILNFRGIDREVFVVDLVTMPDLPITWSTAIEEPYAKALDDALRTGKITKPGKYGIGIDTPVGPTTKINYDIYTIKE